MNSDRNFRAGLAALALLASAHVLSWEETEDNLPFVYLGPELPGIAAPAEPELDGGIDGQPAPNHPSMPWTSSHPNPSGQSATASLPPTRR